RALFDIVWGCLVTIFAFTWAALHQNVPDPKLGWSSLLLRKLRMMLVMIFAPEFVVAFAGRQLVSALWISKEFHVSKTHGFFCTMGGFVSQERHPIVETKELRAYMPAIRVIDEEDIKDRSKGDALSKGVAITQGLWFLTQALARVSQRLPLTQLEVATLAFGVLSIFIRVLWWWKPLDVERPIVLLRSKVDLDEIRSACLNTTMESQLNINKPAKHHRLALRLPSSLNALLIYLSEFSCSTSIAHPHLNHNKPSNVRVFYYGSVSATEPQVITLKNYSVSDKFIEALSGQYLKYSPISSTSVPSFYSIPPDTENTYSKMIIAGLCGAGTIFGGIHSTAWNAFFPSTTEMFIWRMGCVFITTYPVLCWAVGTLLESPDDNRVLARLGETYILFGGVFYNLCRLFLTILCFTTLRALPPGTFVDVNWSYYIPHL
ncbi:hypothetical protein B0H16DRAFT_1263605, partial [Mycena metata]